ncbi:MAG: twin-arginine translocase TatA/TatE family subunit [Alphaproteobacteria bacterium]
MSIGIWQVVLVLAIILIIFGAGKLPRVMGDVAKGVKSFKSGMQDEGDEARDAKTVSKQVPSDSPAPAASTTTEKKETA